MKKHYLLLLLWLGLVNVYAQKVIVKDAQTGNSISNVFVFSQCKSALTDIDGTFDITGFCEDSTITFQHASYILQTLKVNNIKSDTTLEVLLIPDIFNIQEVVVAASKWNEEHREVPLVIDKIMAQKARIYSPQTSADLLSANSKVFVQKSQLGGGSPMIRGFSANRVLLVVDGVRLNNAIYRGGNLQNVLSIDVNSVDNVEVIFGPGSVMYGSDALGGVMSYSTLHPEFSDSLVKTKTNAMMRYSSANNEKTGSASLKILSKKWSSVTSLSNSYFGDLRMGSVGHPSYDRQFYVLNNGKQDSVVNNRDRNIQVGSAYSQFNILQKVAYKPNRNWQLDYNFYYSQASDVPRYDRLIQIKNNMPKYANWYYGPQKWLMNSLIVSNHKHNILYDELKATIAYQNYQESRHKRKLNKDILNQQLEEVNMASVNIDLYKRVGCSNTIYYGVEGLFNLVGSNANNLNIYDNTKTDAPSRYPDGSKYYSGSAYLTDKYYISEKWIANAGIRMNYSSVFAEFSKVYHNFPYENANNQNTALSGNMGLVLLPNMTSKISINLSSGFRAPNVDDLAKVFDSGMGTIVVPNPDLKPEQVYNIDLTFEKHLWKKFHILINGFYSYLDKAMVVSDYSFAGQDSIIYDDEMSKVLAVTNKDFAKIYGVQAGVDWRFYKNFIFKTSANYTKGHDSQGYAIRHVAPFFGSTHIIYDNSKLIVDVYSNYNGRIVYDDLAQTERVKTHIYEEDKNGLPYAPEWQTYNLKFSYRINSIFSVTTGIENIFDVRYRPYSSGIAAPGRNFIISLRLSSF